MALMIGNGPNRGQSPPPPKYKPPAAAPPPVDALESIKALIASLSGGGGNVDYQAQANDIYAPQFSYLDKLGQESAARANAAKKDVSGLYNALSTGILGQEGGIKSNYDQGINSVGKAYNDALGSIEGQFDSTRNNSAEILERLGIQQAGSNVVGKSNELEQLLTGILSANGMSTQNSMRQSKEGAVTYNKQQGGAAKLAGAEAQTGIARQLGDFMAQLSGKKADLNQQVNQSAFDMQQGDQKSALQQAQDQYKMMLDERDFNYTMAKDKADFDLRASNQSGSKEPKIDPLGSVQQLAMNLYGNQQGASNAMKSVTDALMAASSEGKPSLGEFLKTLETRLKGANGQISDWSNLQRLATMLYNQ